MCATVRYSINSLIILCHISPHFLFYLGMIMNLSDYRMSKNVGPFVHELESWEMNILYKNLTDMTYNFLDYKLASMQRKQLFYKISKGKIKRLIVNFRGESSINLRIQSICIPSPSSRDVSMIHHHITNHKSKALYNDVILLLINIITIYHVMVRWRCVHSGPKIFKNSHSRSEGFGASVNNSSA